MTPEDLPKHRYLRNNRPDWSKSITTIKEQGGPWWCSRCETVSMLVYRCSVCGAEMDESETHAIR